MAILSTLSQQQSVTKVFNVVRCTRDMVFKKWRQKEPDDTAIVNLYIAPIIPERGILRRLSRPLNRFLLHKINSKAIQRSKKNKNLAWCYWPKGFIDFDFFGLDIDMVFDTDHNIIDEPNNLEEQKAEKKEILLQAGKRAKYILSSSRSMLHWYHRNELNHTELLMNGVFENRINLKPSNLETVNYTVTYSGTLSKWIKTAWLTKIVQDHSDWTFNFIGYNYKTDIASLLEHYSNVHMHGFLEPADVDAIVKQSDVCFGLYQQDDALDVNSMKLYDYLAQGIPVVVNDYHPNLHNDFNGLLNIASTYEEFENLMKNPNSFSKEKIERFLISSTWNERVQPIIEHLNA